MNVRVELPAIADASFGAALLAGVGIGAYSDEAAAEAAIRIVATNTPDPERVAFYEKGFHLYREIQAALAPLNHRIHAHLAEA